jgi:NAD(P)-dependent dehydrogenase (short-subunit alcohol dehydrogenase family)
MPALLQDKVAIITGAGAGIGEAIARAFAAEGAHVVVSDIDAGRAQRVADSLPSAIAVTADVRDEDAVRGLVDAAVKEFGGLHVVVPNAGIATTVPLTELSFSQWRDVMSVNLTSTAGSALIASYAAAKAAVRNLTETVSAELRGHGIRANALLPGFIDTELVTSHQADFEAALGLEAGGFDDVIAAKQTRYGRVEEIAAAAVFFASDQSSWCNGSSLILDGGFRGSLL